MAAAVLQYNPMAATAAAHGYALRTATTDVPGRTSSPVNGERSAPEYSVTISPKPVRALASATSPPASPMVGATATMPLSPPPSGSDSGVRLAPQAWVLGYLDAFLERLRDQELAEVGLHDVVVLPPSPPPSSIRGDCLDWQATFLSPVHTKLRRGPSPDAAARERQTAAGRGKFNGVLPFYRVWQLRVEASAASPPVMGRGTPARPHQEIFERELSATKLFLRDYSRRRGLASSAAPVCETVVDVHRLLRPRTVSSFPVPASGGATSPIAIQTQSLAPDRVVERRRLAKSPPVRSMLAVYDEY